MSDVIVDGKTYAIPDSFTYREMGTIKQISGVRAGHIADALEHGDTDLIVAITVVAMRRAGHDVDADYIFDLDSSAIEIRADEPEVDDSPPAVAAPAGDAGVSASM